MTKKQKKLLTRILTAGGAMVLLAVLPVKGLPRFFLYLIPYLIVGYDVLRKAGKGIIGGQIFDECFLMAVATVGALFLGLMKTGDYVEAVAVMLLYQLGEFLQRQAVGKSRKSIAALMDIRPDRARVCRDGKCLEVSPEEVTVGEVIRVYPGEKIPLDGVVLEGVSLIDTSALTGESLPREIGTGDGVLSGSLNTSGPLTLRTTKGYGESTVAKILELVENAAGRKSRSEKLISSFARIYTPAVCLSALILALLPPTVNLFLGEAANFGTWLYRALSFLVASCPCALVISIPLTFFAGIGGASREGILIKGSQYLETLSKVDTLVLDKTGTLTKGSFQVSEMFSPTGEEEKLLETAALAESTSHHPIAIGIREAWGKALDPHRIQKLCEVSGGGIIAEIDGKKAVLGKRELLEENGVPFTPPSLEGTVVHLSLDGVYFGSLALSDEIKEGAEEALRELSRVGVGKTVMLTGDSPEVAKKVARSLGISSFHASLLPRDKVEWVEKLLGEERAGKKLAFAGDGINDAPVLSRADLGFAMGALGSDAAIEAADVVIMDDDIRKIPKAIRIARVCLAIVKQNLVFAIGIKVLSLLLIALGMGNMVLAVFADVGVMILAVLNAGRALLVKKM